MTSSAIPLECGVAILSTGKESASTYATLASIAVTTEKGDSAAGLFTPTPGATIKLAPGYAVITMGRLTLDALSGPLVVGSIVRVSDDALALVGAELAIDGRSLTVAVPTGLQAKEFGLLDLFLARSWVAVE